MYNVFVEMSFQALILGGVGEMGTLSPYVSLGVLRMSLCVYCVWDSGYLVIAAWLYCKKGEGLLVFVFLGCGMSVA